MVADSASVSSFSSLDNVSRSSMLRRQREAALRRRQNHVPVRNDASGDGSRAASYTMSSMPTTAMADVMAWEETKTKERIEARIREEEIQREDEVRMAAERANAAEAEAKAARIAKLERFEKAREDAAQRREDEARRLAEAKAAADRLEKERLVAEATKMAELERFRLENELKRERLEKERLATEREKVEAERLAEHARLIEQQSLERQSSTRFQGGDQATAYPHLSNRHLNGNGMRLEQQQVPPTQTNHQTGPILSEQPSRPMTVSNEEAYGQFSHDMEGSNNGYQRYLTTYHQSAEDATIISELTDGNSPHGSRTVNQAEKSTTQNTELRGSKIKRSISTRSLSFTEVNEADQSTIHIGMNSQLASSNDPREDTANSKGDTTEPLPSKISSLQQITSIESANLDDPKIMRSFVMKPCPKGEGMVQCCIRRSKGIKNALFPEYRMYLKSNNSKTETFLMTSKKRVGNKTSNYLISMNRNDHDKNSDSILGKLRSNFLGTEYMIYDHGKNPDYDDSYYDEKNDGDIRCELGAILYAANTSLGSKGPRKMKVCIGRSDDDGNPVKVWQPTKKDDERMVTCFKKETSNLDKLVRLENKPPSWNEEVGAYVLNFNGRVTMASVKNFQLCDEIRNAPANSNASQQNTMQFGRIAKNEFSLDVQWPMSLFQAFSVALSSFDSKLGCD
ncbi:hypothetical protein ACHAXR_007363 [Thalassiosira sp. AJA248-18]